MEDEPIKTEPTDPLHISDADRLISHLRERDEPCPLCGYNLRNLTSSRCPECGELLKLCVAQAAPYLKAWIAVLAANCTCAGLGVVWILMTLRRGPPRIGAYILVFHMLTIPCLPILIRKRTAFLKQAKETQWVFAWIAMLISVASIAGVAFYVN